MIQYPRSDADGNILHLMMHQSLLKLLKRQQNGAELLMAIQSQELTVM